MARSARLRRARDHRDGRSHVRERPSASERTTGQLCLGDQLQGDRRRADRDLVNTRSDPPASGPPVVAGQQARVGLDANPSRLSRSEVDPLESQQPQPLFTRRARSDRPAARRYRRDCRC